MGEPVQVEERPRRPYRPLVLAACLAVLIAGLIAAADRRDDGEQSSMPSTSAAAAASVTTVGGTTLPTTAATTAQSTTVDRRAVTTLAQARPSTTSARGIAGPVQPGTWGGQGIRVVVSAGGGSVEYDCAVGSINEPLVVTSGGSFEASGTHTVQRGGPPQPGTVPRSQPVRYSGSTDGSHMRLTVSLPDTGGQLGPFMLGLGQQALLDRCG